jgi:transposase
LEGAIARLDDRVDEVIAPFAAARDRLDTITGVGKRAAETIIAEIGTDMTVFPTAGHLASWAGRCPGNNPDRRQTPLRQADQGQPLAG